MVPKRNPHSFQNLNEWINRTPDSRTTYVSYSYFVFYSFLFRHLLNSTRVSLVCVTVLLRTRNEYGTCSMCSNHDGEAMDDGYLKISHHLRYINSDPFCNWFHDGKALFSISSVLPVLVSKRYFRGWHPGMWWPSKRRSKLSITSSHYPVYS